MPINRPIKLTKLTDPVERTHGEMNAAHYKALREDPMYALDFNMDIIREELSQGVYGHFASEPEEPKERIVAHIYMGEKSLQLNRRVGDLEESSQEHYQYHSKKKGKSYQFNSVKAKDK